MLRRMALLLMSLEFVACAVVPKVPHHIQWGIYPNVNPPGFYGTDNETKEHFYLPFNSPKMAGGQALSAPDYKAWARWVSTVKQQAETRCH